MRFVKRVFSEFRAIRWAKFRTVNNKKGVWFNTMSVVLFAAFFATFFTAIMLIVGGVMRVL